MNEKKVPNRQPAVVPGDDPLVVMASKFGGMEIEEVAHKDPTAILKEPFDAIAGLASRTTAGRRATTSTRAGHATSANPRRTAASGMAAPHRPRHLSP